jgi:hypothetical protein
MDGLYCIMADLDDEKNKLINKLSEQYSQNMIDMEEYERIIEYANKIETKREVRFIEKIINENGQKDNNELLLPGNNRHEKHLAVFSWNSSIVKPSNGNGGMYLSLFGANRIIIDNLPKGKTLINVNAIFGLTEIIVSKEIKIINKIVPVFSGIFAPDEINEQIEEPPELYITGKAIFGEITIVRK